MASGFGHRVVSVDVVEFRPVVGRMVARLRMVVSLGFDVFRVELVLSDIKFFHFLVQFLLELMQFKLFFFVFLLNLCVLSGYFFKLFFDF